MTVVHSPLGRALLIALLTTWCGSALAVPTTIPYAGYLTHENGQPYEGLVDVMAGLYGCPQAGDGTCDALWEADTMAAVQVTNGILSFELADDEGSLTDVLTEGSDLWLDIALLPEGDAQWTLLEPRHRLLSVPYAVSSHDSEQLGGLDASEYVTAVEADLFVTLQQLEDEGYLPAADLAAFGYVTSAMLANYTTTEALEDDYPNWDALNSTLSNYVLNSTLSSYLTQTQLNEQLSTVLESYVETSALSSYVQEATLAGYVTVEEQYTDEDAKLAVQNEGYAKLTDIPSLGFTTTPSTSSLSLTGPLAGEQTVDLVFPVEAKIAKQHIRVDIQVRTDLTIEYMDYGLDPPGSVAAEVTHAAYLEGDIPTAPLYTDRLIQSPPREPGDSTNKGDIKQYSYLFELTEDEANQGTTVTIMLKAKCSAAPQELNVGCSVYVALERITISGF